MSRRANARGTAIRQGLTLLMLLVIPLAATLAFLWDLHTPKPRVKTPTVITRSSLLPHRYAGPCMNCHRIQEIGPVTMNRDNMQLFALTEQQRRLLLAGQRVEVPSLAQRMRTPAIWRDDILPHSYVGVCSNCHLLLNVRPGDAYWSRAMRRAYQPLQTQGWPRERIARGGVREYDRRELYRNLWGFAALGFFSLACVYVVLRILMQRYPKALKGKVKIKPWFQVHEWCSLGFTTSAIMHWYYSVRGNNFLHVALLLVIWLTVAGYVLRYRMSEKGLRKNVRLLHSQRFFFFGLVFLLVIGHFFAEFE